MGWFSSVNLKLARHRREWGLGDGGLSLSATARPIEALEGGVRLSSWARLNFLSGVLGDWTQRNTEQKMLPTQLITGPLHS